MSIAIRTTSGRRRWTWTSAEPELNLNPTNADIFVRVNHTHSRLRPLYTPTIVPHSIRSLGY